MKPRSIMAVVLLLPAVCHAEVKQAYGADQQVDYRSLEKFGAWDDRNYKLKAKDLAVLPKNDQYLKNVPVFFKIEMRKNNPNLGEHYPRSAYQEFQMKYGGILKDGVWKVEGLGLHYMKGAISKNKAAAIPGIPDNLADTPITIEAVAAEYETALATGVSGNEVTIECNPTNANNCVAGSNQSGGQAMYYSTDAGATWTKSQTNSGSCCDPTIDWSSDGSIVYQGDLSGPNIGVRWSRSLDQGITWEPMKSITTSGSDKEFIHVDRSSSSPHQDNIYMTWHDGNVMQFARSTDMGVSFSNPISFNSEPRGIGSDITTDSAGNIYYFYPSTDGSGVRMLKSTNGGASFASGIQVSALNGDFDFPVPAMETREVFIYTSADVSRDNDNIFVAWTDEADDSAGNGTGSASNNRAVIKVARSSNGGASWSMCPDPHSASGSLSSGNPIDRFHPWIKVDENGVVHIAYYDTRHSNNRTGVDFYYNRSVDDCNSWDTEMRYSTQTSANLNDGQEWGDYNGLSVVLDRMAMSWTDNRAGKVAMIGSGSVDDVPDPDPDPDPDPVDTVLENGVAKTGLSGAQGSEQFFTLAVPANATDLNFAMSGGSGDADLYVRFGEQPTQSTYDCRPYQNGNNESCDIGDGQVGTYHVMLRAYSAYSGVNLVANYTVTDPDPDPPGDTLLLNGVPKTGLTAAQNAQLNFTMVVPAGASDLAFVMSGGSGDADMYVRFGSAPTTSSYDCRPYRNGNNESCDITNVQTGTYYVMLNGYSAFSGVSLTGSFSSSTGETFFENTNNVNIPDNNSTGASSSINSTASGNAGTITVSYDIVHTYIGDLTVYLIDPDGVQSTLRSRSGGSANDISESKTVNKGTTPAAGTWQLKVVDSAGQDVGYIDAWSIQF
jgi:hypothetical protein